MRRIARMPVRPHIPDQEMPDPREGKSQGAVAASRARAAELSVLALTAYYGAHYRELLGYAYKFVGDTAQAEDAVQQTFANTLDAIRKGTQVDNISAWLHRCIRNLALEQRRHDPFLALNEAIAADHVLSPTDQVALKEGCDAVRDAVDTLPDHMRTAFLLAAVRGLTYKEVAASLDRSVHSVRQMISRARQHVREIAGPANLPAASPLLGLRLSGIDFGSPLHAARAWAATRWNDFQNWLAAFVSRLADPLAAPATSLIVAALVAGGLTAQPSTAGHSVADGGAPGLAASLSLSSGQPRSRDRGPQARHRAQPPAAPKQAQKPVATQRGRDQEPTRDTGSGKDAASAGSTHAAKPVEQPPPIHDPGPPPSGPEGGLLTKGYDGSMADDSSGQPVVSPGGDGVAFSSVATNIVPGDTNGAMDVFATNLEAQATARVSVGANGQPADGPSSDPAIASDEKVAFSSIADNLVAGDTNGLSDVFVRDMQAGVTGLVSDASQHQPANGPSGTPAISASGRFVAFASQATNLVSDPAGEGNSPPEAPQVPADRPPDRANNVFVRDLQSRATVLVSRSTSGGAANGDSHGPSIGADGRYVAFVSTASNLVAGDGNGVADVFVFDRQTKTIERVTRSAGGGDANGPSDQPKISADGRYVVFASTANNLDAGDTDRSSDIYSYDRVRQQSRLASGPPTQAQIANADCPAGTSAVVQASLADPGANAVEPTIGGHGRLIAFQAPITATAVQHLGRPPSESQVFWRDMATGAACLAIRDIDSGNFRWPTRDPALNLAENMLVFVGARDFSAPGRQLDYLGVFFRQLR